MSSVATISFVGDVMLARGVGERIAEGERQFIANDLLTRLRASDLRCANLESPLTTSAQPVVPCGFQALSHALEIIQDFNVVTIANNHLGDCGDGGVDETIALLRTHGIQYMGAGADANEAYRPATFERQGVRLSFLGCVSQANRPQDGLMRHELAVLEDARFLKTVERTRSEADAVIVLVHGGDEYSPYPPPQFRSRLLELVDAGAALVVTHHPHVLGAWEEPRPGRLIWYSLGDFIFDSGVPSRRRSGMLEVHLDSSGVRGHEFIPTYADDRYCVWPAEGAIRETIDRKLRRVSRDVIAAGYSACYKRLYRSAFASFQVERLHAIARQRGMIAAVKAFCGYCGLAVKNTKESTRR